MAIANGMASAMANGWQLAITAQSDGSNTLVFPGQSTDEYGTDLLTSNVATISGQTGHLSVGRMASAMANAIYVAMFASWPTPLRDLLLGSFIALRSVTREAGDDE
jgi:hypothetical protein